MSRRDNIDRRSFCGAAAAGSLAILGSSRRLEAMTDVLTEVAPAERPEPSDIRPFRINVPDTELADLRRRIKATRWPEREQVADATQGVQLATMQSLARYWATDYDWRKVEARLNAMPQFITTVDGRVIELVKV
jgi:hypothetical protein